MSYDITVAGDWHNYTSNMRQFFQDFGVYPPDWAGRPRREVGKEIRAAIKVILSNPRPELRDKYNSPNGWGDIDSAIEFLRKVARSCEKSLSRTVDVSW